MERKELTLLDRGGLLAIITTVDRRIADRLGTGSLILIFCCLIALVCMVVLFGVVDHLHLEMVKHLGALEL